MVEDLRSQLRIHDAFPTREDGIPEGFMTETQRGYNNSTIDRLTKYSPYILTLYNMQIHFVVTAADDF